LAFVALALLLIPTQFDGVSTASGLPNETVLLDRVAAVPPRAMLGASLPRNFAGVGRDAEQAGPPPRREPFAPPPGSPGMSEQAAPPRGFSPIVDRPEPPPPAPPVEVAVPPPQPPPQPPPEAPPPPNVVIQQPQQPDADGPRREVTVQ
jgi:hypothetical protein